MRHIDQVIFTNMLLIRRGDEVVVIERSDPSWSGIAFPGGHVEAGEDFLPAAIREAKEETGLDIFDLRLCGIKHWTREDGVRYLVFLYETEHFTGTLCSSEEGRVFWARLDELSSMPLCATLDITLRVYLEDKISEHAMHRGENGWNSILYEA